MPDARKLSEKPDFTVYQCDDGWMAEMWTGPADRKDIAGPFKTKDEAETVKNACEASHD